MKAQRTPDRKLALQRSIEQWRSSDPVAMAEQSKAAIYFAFQDARADILALAEALKRATGEQP